MGYETVSAITDNIEATLTSEGLNVTRKALEIGGSVPAGLLPMAQVWHKGEVFEDTYGERPAYAEARFAVKVILSAKDGLIAAAEEQQLAHQVRSALTVSALNTGELAAARPVSVVRTHGYEIERSGNLATMSMDMNVRYRE